MVGSVVTRGLPVGHGHVHDRLRERHVHALGMQTPERRG